MEWEQGQSESVSLLLSFSCPAAWALPSALGDAGGGAGGSRVPGPF